VGTQPFEVTVRDRTVRVHGDVDMIVAERLRQSIERAARDGTSHTVVVDLERTTFMDSAGIRC
jgi:anti-anti-sigma factor